MGQQRRNHAMKKAPTEPPVRTGYLPDESGAMTDSANAAQEAASFDVRTDPRL